MSIQPIGLAPAGVPSVPLASETDLAQPIGGTPEVSFGDVLQGALRTTVEAGHEATMKEIGRASCRERVSLNV